MIKNYSTINKNLSLTKALEYLSKAKNKCLIVVDKNKSVIGTLTDGDVRRSLIKSKDLNNKVGNICNKKFFTLRKIYLDQKYMKSLKNRTPLIPV